MDYFADWIVSGAMRRSVLPPPRGLMPGKIVPVKRGWRGA